MSLSPLETLVARAGEVVLGKERHIRLALACLLSRGHLLIEDVPGVGKTTLAQVLSRLLGLQFQRIQFTSDLLPADIIGVAIFERQNNVFRFHPGPIFCQLLLADEVNRATPKTQSALLEAMEERQVTTEGATRPLPTPFFVIATQNPGYQIGTFPLPESQLDRFLMRIHLGFPDRAAERLLLKGQDRRELLAGLAPAVTPAQLADLQLRSGRVHVSDALLDYVQALVARSRSAPGMGSGLSPRAALSLLAAARSWALMAGRDSVLPEDIQAVLPAVANHRLRPAGPGDAAAELIAAVAIP